MIPASRQLKAAPKKIVKALLRAEDRQRTVAFYTGVSLMPEEYLVVHQEADEATKEKIKTEAQARRETQKKKRLFGSLAHYQRTPASTV